MIVFDTDHVSVLQLKRGDRLNRLVARMALTIGEKFQIPIVAVEETMRGWMTSIAKERHARRQIGPYRELGQLFGFFARFEFADFDERAVALFDTMGSIQIGRSDRKIAAIAIANDALLLTANRRDFDQVPNLRFENWMDEPVV